MISTQAEYEAATEQLQRLERVLSDGSAPRDQRPNMQAEVDQLRQDTESYRASTVPMPPQPAMEPLTDEDVTLSPEEEARFEAAIAQADQDVPPTRTDVQEP
jgi:hypothetical protein